MPPCGIYLIGNRHARSVCEHYISRKSRGGRPKERRMRAPATVQKCDRDSSRVRPARRAESYVSSTICGSVPSVLRAEAYLPHRSCHAQRRPQYGSGSRRHRSPTRLQSCFPWRVPVECVKQSRCASLIASVCFVVYFLDLDQAIRANLFEIRRNFAMSNSSQTPRCHIDEHLNKARGWLHTDGVEPALCELDKAVRIVEACVREDGL